MNIVQRTARMQIAACLNDPTFDELRVCQLIFNALDRVGLARNVVTGEPRDLFYVTDEELAEAFRRFYVEFGR